MKAPYILSILLLILLLSKGSLSKKDCGQGKIFVRGSCRNQCGDNRYQFGFTCYCISGKYKYVPSRGGCYQKAKCKSKFEVVDSTGTQCLCIDGYERDPLSNVCQRPFVCSKPNEVLAVSGSKCVCSEGYETNAVTNGCSLLCQQNSQRNLYSGICECNNGYDLSSSTNLCEMSHNCTGDYAYDPSSNTCVCKPDFIQLKTGGCISQTTIKNCHESQVLVILTGECSCLEGFQFNEISLKCEKNDVVIQCSENQIIEENQCVCKPGYILFGDQCFGICSINQVYSEEAQACRCLPGYVKQKNVCRQCPQNTIAVNDSCECTKGLQLNMSSNQCELTCPQNYEKKEIDLGQGNKHFICLCKNGFMIVEGQCIQIPIQIQECPPVEPPKQCLECPQGATWNGLEYKCQCTSTELHLIGGSCQECGENRYWDGRKCICKNGFHLIQGNCAKCDINSVYTSGRCFCNFGFYDETGDIQNTICKACHLSCGTCSGPSDNQCITCSNFEDTLNLGVCTPNGLPCQRGYFQNTSGQCQNCNQYCEICEDQNICIKCVTGFQVERFEIFGQVSAFCPQVCGDGMRFEYDCDDGNVFSDDGCDENCFIEQGYTCNAGSSTSPSVCLEMTPTRTYMTTTKHIRLLSSIVQGVTLTYLPTVLTNNFCQSCNDILLVKMIRYTILPSVVIEYLPTTKFKFLLTFGFNGIFALPSFIYSVQINPKYAENFSEEDMAIKEILSVNPVTLAIKDEVEELKFGNLHSQDLEPNPFNIFEN